MNKDVSNILDKIVNFKQSQSQPVLRTFIAKVALELQPTDTYGTKTQFGRHITKYMEETAANLNAHYVKDANGRNARIEF